MTINRYKLNMGAKDFVNKEEIHLVVLLIENLELAVKLQNIIGENFIGFPQGDAASALFCIKYLALTIKPKNFRTKC